MSGAESGSPVSNGCSSPLSPDPLLDSAPLTLDFDPMSFQFKEFASPTEEEPPLSPTEQDRRTPTLTLFDPFATISPDDSDLAFEQMINVKESHFDPLSNVTPEEPDILMDPFGITSDLYVPQEYQNGVEVTEVVTSDDVLACAVHETSEPDILLNPSVCNTNNPDLILIDTQEPDNIDTGVILTSDLVATATITNTNNDGNRVLECAVTTVTATCVESVFVQDGSSHADDFPVVNVLEHGYELIAPAKDLATAVKEDFSESDSETESLSNKRVTTLNKKKTSSISSESSLSENESSGKSSKQTLIKQSSTVEKSVTVVSKGEIYKETASVHLNGMDPKDKAMKKAPLPPKQDILKDRANKAPKPSPPIAKKTSFNKTQEEVENFTSIPVEEVKPSVDRAQVTRKFSQRGSEDVKSLCRICNKHVYQMEKVKAEKSVFHKDCFKCKECGKKLTVDTYSSHEKELFCKPHFKQLFQPKSHFGGEDTAPRKQRRNEMVICENTPVELPPDVVRCETKSNDLDSLPSLNLGNIKSRFESQKDELHLPNTSDLCTLQRSPSLLARMAKYQSAVSGDHANGDLSGGEDEADRDTSIVREPQLHEKVMFSGMSTLKTQWETGHMQTNEDHDDVKDHLAKLRQRMCLGRSESMKAVYEKACEDSKSPLSQSENIVLGRDIKALSIKEKFEKGSIEKDEEIEAERHERLRREKEDDLSCLVETGTAEGARNLFKQMDAVAHSGGSRSPNMPLSPMRSSSTVFQQQGPVVVADVIKCSPPTEKDDIQVETVQISEKFRFFEKYQEPQKERKRFQITPPRDPVKDDTPDRELTRDPNIIRCTDAQEDDLPATDTAKKMLNKFKALESQAENPVPVPSSQKPLKRITPPREPEHKAPSPEPTRQPDPDIVRCSYKAEEDVNVVEADKAKSLKAKFENWTTEVVRENLKNEKQLDGGSGGEEDYLPQADMTKTLRAMFESIKDTDPLKATAVEKPKPKVSRFIEQQHQMANGDVCASCDKRIYPMEKLEASGMKLHKNCFRCAHCNCVLRLENYTTSGGKLFCVTHFKQLFISKGNYDEGFGREQHKEKWNRSRSNTPTPRDECASNGHSSFTEKTSEVVI